MSTHYDEEAQVEALRRWMKENGFALVAGLALGFGVIFGLQALKAHRDARRVEASQLFESMTQALDANKPGDADTMGKRLVEAFASTPYAAQAQLALARVALDAGRLEEARTRLQWVVDYESHRSMSDRLSHYLPSGVAGDARDPGLGDVARLRLARVLWQMGKGQDALDELAAHHAPAFDALFDELRGDVLLSRNDRAGARSAYQQALQLSPDDAKNRGQLQQKIDSLADVAGAAS